MLSIKIHHRQYIVLLKLFSNKSFINIKRAGLRFVVLRVRGLRVTRPMHRQVDNQNRGQEQQDFLLLHHELVVFQARFFRVVLGLRLFSPLKVDTILRLRPIVEVIDGRPARHVWSLSAMHSRLVELGLRIVFGLWLSGRRICGLRFVQDALVVQFASAKGAQHLIGRRDFAKFDGGRFAALVFVRMI
jgi:hypothetical protein